MGKHNMSERRASTSRDTLAPPGGRAQTHGGTWHGPRRRASEQPLARAGSIFDRRPSFVPPSRVQVQVKAMDGTRIGIDFKGTATLADLKELLHKNLGLPKSDQRFALVGQILDDTRPVGTISTVPLKMLQTP